MNPGPGEYDQNDAAIKTSVKTVIINQSERQDLWDEDVLDEFPGPGNYAEAKSTFGQTSNAPSIAFRHRERINSNPGPGQYDAQV